MKKSSRWCGLSIPPTAPVVLSIFLTACSQVGTIKSTGIYLEDISGSLGTTPTDIGVALGLFTAFSYFPALLVTALNRLKWLRRPILITGSILISLGVIMASCATNNLFIDIFLALAGLGQCMLLIASTIALDQIVDGQTFNRLYGLGMSGFGLGMVLLPYAADILGRAYGWRGGLLILGGVMANLLPCAIAIQSGVQTSVQGGICDGLSDASRKDGSTEGRWSNGSDRTVTVLEKCLCKTKCFQNCQNKKTFKPFGLASQKHEMACGFTFDWTLARFRSTDYYTDPIFNFMFAADFIFGVMYCGWHSFLVPHALQRGYSVKRTIIMTLFASIGNFSGRLLAGTLSDRLTDPIILHMSAAILNVISILCDVLVQHYYVMAVSSCLTAIGISSMAILLPLAVRKRSSPGTFDVAFAISQGLFGLGTFFGGYLSGMVAERFSSYDATFKLLVGVDLLVFVLMLPAFIFKKPQNL